LGTHREAALSFWLLSPELAKSPGKLKSKESWQLFLPKLCGASHFILLVTVCFQEVRRQGFCHDATVFARLTHISTIMDIHRCRFVPYPPSAINALAFSHTSAASKNERSPIDLRLALGRANGDIELWNPLGGQWFQETIIRGAKDRSIENLAWTQNWDYEGDGETPKAGRLRLFSIGNSASVTEWDLSLGAPARHANGNFGDLWCFAAQPRSSPKLDTKGENSRNSSPPASQYLAAGCSDGTIVLFSTEDDDLRFAQSLGKPPAKRPHVLSITWKDRNTVVAGYDDSTIRVYDVRSKSILRNMSLGAPGDGKSDVHVWAVRCLPNGDIVSGDSTGQLRIWDSGNYSLVQSIQAHKADILDLVISASGQMIITGGADQRTVAYRLYGPQKGQKGQRWAQIMHRRFHEHDVRAMASFESKEISVVVSGGLDTTPVVVPLKELHTQYHRSLSHLPQKPQICSSPQSRLMLTWWDREISIWYLSRPRGAVDNPGDMVADYESHQLAAKLFLKGDENITSAHISANGTLIVVATTAGVKLFQLRRRKEQGVIRYRTRQLEVPAAIAKFGAKTVMFSPDSHWLCVVRLTNVMVVAKLMHSGSLEERPRFSDRIVKLTRSKRENLGNAMVIGLDVYLDSICSLTFSTDSRVLAVGDLSGRTDTWLLEGYEDTTQEINTINGFTLRSSSDSSSSSSSDGDETDEDDTTVVQGQKWIRNPAAATLPRLDAAVLVLSFRPQDRKQSPQLTNGNVGLHATRHNPHPYSHDLPTGDAKLVAVTATNQVIEFDVLNGGLSDWSRRNPVAYSPNILKTIKDPAMGCFWSAGTDLERVWLYGATWLFMLDMSQDLPDPEVLGRIGHYEVLTPVGNMQRKRRRSNDNMKLPAKRSTGAGDTIDAPDASVSVGQHTLTSRGGGAENQQSIDVEEVDNPDSDSDSRSRLQPSTLALMRRSGKPGTQTNLFDGHGHVLFNGAVQNFTPEKYFETRNSTADAPPVSWHTFQYRSILGIVPIGQLDPQTDGIYRETMDAGGSLEVAIVERPMWDVGYPPRFDGGQDWEA
jgi:U3 small nucleolar RNA-associated protein 4